MIYSAKPSCICKKLYDKTLKYTKLVSFQIVVCMIVPCHDMVYGSHFTMRDKHFWSYYIIV